MIYDCFTIRDELDILELRIKLLFNKVDKFVISEANYTHKGESKPYTFLENENRFSKWSNKIIYLPVDFSDEINNNEYKSDVWVFENKQRIAIIYGLEQCNKDDIITIGDLDEIPNLDNLPNTIDTPMVFWQNFYYYYVNNKSIGPKDILWGGTVVCTFEQLQQTSPQILRNNRWGLKPISNGGWHWSYMGGENMIRQKINSVVEGGCVLSDNDITLDGAINNFKSLKDPYNRNYMNFSLVEIEKEYPPKILEILKDYPQFIYKPL